MRFFLIFFTFLTASLSFLSSQEKNQPVVDEILTQVKIHAKESKLRADLEKDKIGAVKKVFETRLEDTKKIDNREDRLNALIRLHEELDI